MEDTRIIDLFFARDEQALKESDTKYGHYLKTVSYNILRSREDTEECMNDTWIKAWNSIPPNRPAFLKAYFTKIIRNLSLNRVKELHAQKRGGGETDTALEEVEAFLQDSVSVEETVDAILLRDTLNSFVRGLPRQQRLVFMRRYFFLDSVLEIAERYGMTEAKVKTMLFRLRNRLREYLLNEGIEV